MLDILVSSAALLLVSPILLAAAVAVKLTSRGTVFFRQERVGLHGRTFEMLKFRSMVSDAEALKAALAEQNEQTGPVFKMARDPRITRFGRFIRKYSIDELPQLLNVLRGEMTIVGPRPLICEIPLSSSFDVNVAPSSCETPATKCPVASSEHAQRSLPCVARH